MTEHVFALLEDIASTVNGPAAATDSAIALFNGTTGKLLKDSLVLISTDGTFAANSDLKVPTEKAVKTYAVPITDTGTSGHKIPYLDTSNSWSALQTISINATGTLAQVISTDGGAVAGPALDLDRLSATPAINDQMGTLRFLGNSSTLVPRAYGQILSVLLDPANGAEHASVQHYDYVAGAFTLEFTTHNGLLIGAAAGGAQGIGTLNATALYEAGALISGKYQALDGDLTAIAALATVGLAKRTGANAWSIVDGVGSIVLQVFAGVGGTYTPTSGMLHCLAFVVGGGAGGGGTAASGAAQFNGGGGGGGGGVSLSRLTAAQIGASQVVTVGASAAGGVAGTNNGTNGNDSSLGALVIGKGGTAGTGASAGTGGGGGAGGVAGTGDITIPGMRGNAGSQGGINTVNVAAGQGGSSGMGFGAGGGYSSSTGLAGSNYGGGGAGGFSIAASAAVAGGAGAAGLVFIIEFVKV